MKFTENNNYKNIFITGGAGYVGAELTPFLLSKGYKVTIYDLMIYKKNVLPKNKNLKIIKGDLRDKKLLSSSIKGHDCVIHLACISNDPSFELNPNLGKSINLDSFDFLVDLAKKNKIKRFIYASSSSVYGVKKIKNVHEKVLLRPLTDYSRFKAECETKLLNKQDKNFDTVIIRPATVCGYSKRQRFDVVVNLLTNLAVNKGEITVLGGSQLRPNIHIKDMVNAYYMLINAKRSLVAGEIFNAGCQNISVTAIAKTVKKIIGPKIKIIYLPSNDNRSYHISSEKIEKQLGFKFKHTVQDAIKDLNKCFKKKLFTNPLQNQFYFNIKRMQKIKLK